MISKHQIGQKPQSIELREPWNAVFDLALPILVSALFFFLFLGHRPLMDWDEAIYGDIAREFASGSSQLVPFWNFHPWLERTPLFEWITALFFAVFGVSEFWERAASALSGVGVALLTYSLARRMGGRLLAWISLMVLVTMPGFFHQARFGTTDTMLVLWMTLSFYGIYQISNDQLRGWYVFWAGLGLGILTKSAGPAPVVFTLIVVAIKERWSWRKLQRPFWAGLALLVAIVAPWHVYMFARFGKEFFDDYIGRQMLARSVTALEGHNGGPGYYLLLLAQRAAPWCIFLPLAIVRALRNRRLQAIDIYALVVLSFYTLVKTKTPWYITPIYPAVAVIAAQQFEWLTAFFAPRRVVALATPVILLIALAGLQFWDYQRSAYRPELRLVRQNNLRQYEGPFVVCSDDLIIDIPAPLFYTDKRTVQAYLFHKPNLVDGLGPVDPRTTDPKFRNPIQLAQFITRTPHPILIERKLLPALDREYTFHQIASDAEYSLGAVSRRF